MYKSQRLQKFISDAAWKIANFQTEFKSLSVYIENSPSDKEDQKIIIAFLDFATKTIHVKLVATFHSDFLVTAH